MSALVSPVGGRACATLSIFTASTGPRAGTGSPVNGENSWDGGLPVLVAATGWLGRTGVEWLVSARATTAMTIAAAAELDPITIVRRLNLMRPSPPRGCFPGLFGG